MGEMSFMILMILAAFFGFLLPVAFSLLWRERNDNHPYSAALLALGAILMTVGIVMIFLSFAGPTLASGPVFTAVMLSVYFAGLFLNSLVAVVSANRWLQFSLAPCWVLLGVVLALLGAFSPAGTPPRAAGIGQFLIRFLFFGGLLWLLILTVGGFRRQGKREA